MWLLIIKKDGQKVHTLPVSEGELTIGRDELCALRLDDAAISRRHAKIICSAGQLRIVDLASSNGTFVNGRQVKEQVLSANDAITIGRCALIIQARKRIKPRSFWYKAAFGFAGVLALLFLFFVFTGNRYDPEKRLESFLESAEHYQQAGKYDLAARELEKVIEIDSAHQEALAMLQELRQSAAVEEEILKLVAILAKGDSAALVAEEQTLLALIEEYPRLEELGFWLDYIRDTIAQYRQLHDAEVLGDKNKVAVTAGQDNTRPASEKWGTGIPTSQKNSITNITEKSSDKSNSRQQSVGKIEAPHSPLTRSKQSIAVNKAETTKIHLTPEQKETAEQLYYEGYKTMAYKTRNAYLQALVLFKKAQETAPDKEFEFYRKAEAKIEFIKEQLKSF